MAEVLEKNAVAVGSSQTVLELEHVDVRKVRDTAEELCVAFRV
jgi:hypothetical protein